MPPSLAASVLRAGKVDLKHFDFIVAPEHDVLDGQNVISTKGAIHYLTENERILINEFVSKIKKELNSVKNN